MTSNVLPSNLSALLTEKDCIKLVQTEIPTPKDDEVLVKIHSVGICGSDVHYWQFMKIGHFVVKEPMILGHESAGTVVKVGKDVTHLDIGDRVTMEPGVPCGNCEFSKTGVYNLCQNVKFLATPPYHGSMRQFHAHKASYCFKLPDHVTLEEGALLEPLSVGVQACKQAKVGFGDTVLVCGAGPIGLVNLMVAKAAGASKVVCTDIDDQRLKFATDCGCDNVLNVRGMEESQVTDKLLEFFGNRGPDKAIECSGVQSSIRAAIFALRPGGTMALVGMGPKDDVTLPIITASTKELTIVGVFRYANCYPIALNLVASGKVDIKKLITHRFSLKESVEAFRTAASGAGVKIVVNCE